MDDDPESEETSDNEEEATASCPGCNRNFDNEISLNQHLIASERHNWCFVCSRDFATERGLEQVLVPCLLSSAKVLAHAWVMGSSA